MNIQIQHLDRILLATLAGPVSEPDLLQFAGFVNTLLSKLGAVVLDLQKAQFEPAVAATLLRLKKQYEKSKIRFLLVSAELIGADSAAVGDAVGSLNSTESARVLEIFAQDKELAEVKRELAKVRAALLSLLGLKEGVEPLPSDAVTKALHAIEERNRQLLRLFKTLSSEIHHLEGNREKASLPDSDNPTAVRVSETKRRALDIVKSTKALD